MRKSGGKALEQEKKRQPEQEQDNAQDRKIDQVGKRHAHCGEAL